MNGELYIDGLDAALRAIEARGDHLSQQLAAALFAEGKTVMDKAKTLTPVLTGKLRATGHVLAPVRDGNEIVVRLVFGGVAAPYAVFVHENLLVHHPTGQAKFLEQSALEAASGMTRRIAARIEGLM